MDRQTKENIDQMLKTMSPEELRYTWMAAADVILSDPALWIIGGRVPNEGEPLLYVLAAKADWAPVLQGMHQNVQRAAEITFQKAKES